MLAQGILRSIFFALGRSPPKMEIRESRNEGSSRLALIGAEPGNIVVGTQQQDGPWRRSVWFCSNTVARRFSRKRCCLKFQQSLTPQPVTGALRTRSWWSSGNVVRPVNHGFAVSERESSAPRETSDEDLLKSCFERVAAAQAERCDVRPLRAKLHSVDAASTKAQNQTRADDAERNTRGRRSGSRSRTADHEASRSRSRFSPPNCRENSQQPDIEELCILSGPVFDPAAERLQRLRVCLHSLFRRPLEYLRNAWTLKCPRPKSKMRKEDSATVCPA